MLVGTDREGDAGSPPLASKWWETRENCGSRQYTAPRDKLPRDAPRKPSSTHGFAGPSRATRARLSRVPVGHQRALNSGSAACPPPRLSPQLSRASSSAAEAARDAALHALQAAALKRALQPGEARVSAEQGPSSPGSHGRASEQGEETAPRAVRRPASSRGPRPAPAQPLTCQLPASRAFLAPRRTSPALSLPPGRSVRRPSALR